MSATDPVHPPILSGDSELVREIRGQGLLDPRPRYYLVLAAADLAGHAESWRV